MMATTPRVEYPYLVIIFKQSIYFMKIHSLKSLRINSCSKLDLRYLLQYIIFVQI